MREALWPDATAAEHALELKRIIEGKASGLPLAVLIAVLPGEEPAGFVEVGLRSHADGCDPAHAVGFIEGWYVGEAYRNRSIGRRLLAAAEDWARAEGCNEMASDALIDNAGSQRAHEALGYVVVDRCVHYRKPL